jgi:four helix bundle protein
MPDKDLKERTFQFALASIRTARALAGDALGRHLLGQVIRSSSSVAANYIAACHAKSRRDFAAKISIVAEEAAETVLWFQLFDALGLLPASAISPLVREGRELTAIAVASARTARAKAKEQDSSGY